MAHTSGFAKLHDPATMFPSVNRCSATSVPRA
jgi:hypothetical protein